MLLSTAADYVIFCLGLFLWFVMPVIWYTNPNKYENAKRELFKNKGALAGVLIKSDTIILSILVGLYAYLKINLKYFWLFFSLFFTVIFLFTIVMLFLAKILGYDKPVQKNVKYENENSWIAKMKVNKSLNFAFLLMWIISWIDY